MAATNRNMIIASTSTLFGQKPLEYLLPELEPIFREKQISELLFIPFARPGGLTHDEYTDRIRNALKSLNVNVKGIHEFENQRSAIEDAEAIFTGGGNTFLLVKALHDHDLMQTLRNAIYSGTFYLGTSAGSNICGLNMMNTNDMPVVYPSSFKTTGAISYNINAHYQDPVKNDQHMGETREQRIKEFHTHNSIPVLGLREGSYIRVTEGTELLKGAHTARLFRQNEVPEELKPNTDLSTIN
ncbi:MAG: dipeptidase PepE [Nonlabens sp.]